MVQLDTTFDWTARWLAAVQSKGGVQSYSHCTKLISKAYACGGVLMRM